MVIENSLIGSKVIGMSDREHEWIEKYRAALDQNPPRSERRLFRTVLAALTLAAVCLGSAIYVFSVHLR